MTRRLLLALTEAEIETTLEALRGAPGSDARGAMISIRSQHRAATNAPADGECAVCANWTADSKNPLTAPSVEFAHATAIYHAADPDDPTELVALLVGPDQVAIPRRVLVALAGRAAVEDVEDQCDEDWGGSQ